MALTACSGDAVQEPLQPTDGESAARTVSRVVITPNTVTLQDAGQTINMKAEVRDRWGWRIFNVPVTWSTVDPDVAQVSPSGEVTAIGQGEIEVRASANGVTGTATVHVLSAPVTVASVRLTPEEARVGSVGQSVQLSATAHDVKGTKLQTSTFAWQSLDPKVATVSGSGRVFGLSSGWAMILASHLANVDTAYVYVALPYPSSVAVAPAQAEIGAIGGTVALKATVRNRNNSISPRAVASWTSLDSTVATVEDGEVRGVKAGSARIVARFGKFADTAVVKVGSGSSTPGKESIVVSPKADTIPVGSTLDLKAVHTDAKGATVAGKTILWASLDTKIATVSSSGRVTAVAPGTARIAGGLSTALNDTAFVTVVPVTSQPNQPNEIVVSPKADTIPTVGGTLDLKAVVTDAKGATANATVTWTSLNPSIVGVVASGRVTGVAKGVGRIVASSGVAKDTATVWVAPAAAADPDPVGESVVVSPEKAAIGSVGGTTQLSAVVTDANGAPTTSKTVLWASLDANVASVNASGRVTGVAPGTARIVGGLNAALNDTALVTVAAGTNQPNGISLNPTADTIPTVGGTLRLTATVTMSNGGTLASGTIAWATLDGSIATVNGGTVTGRASGVARVTATYGAFSDTAWVWVAPSTGGGQIPTTPGGVLTPSKLMAAVGPVVPRASNPLSAISGFDVRYAAAEAATYSTWLAGGQQGADGSSHYGALRSRYHWSLRNGLPVGPGAPASSAYRHGVEMTRAYLNKYAKPASFKAAPHNNTAMADVEILYVLEGDPVALEHLKAIAHYYGALYIEQYFDLTGPNSDPRQSAVLLQAMNVAARMNLPYTGRASWGSSWKQAASYIVGRMATQINNGKVVSLAHFNTGQGDQAFFMSAMLATELLQWHGFVEPQPSWLTLARQIVDHLITEQNNRGGACLPYRSSQSGCATDLAAFYVWPSLVLWQETGNAKYRDFALKNVQAAQGAYLVQTKIFNQAYSTGAQTAEALLAGKSWR